MSRSGELPGPESDAEAMTPSGEGITPEKAQEPGRSHLVDVDEPLPEVWRRPDGHDEWCESYWDDAVKMDHPCGCSYRIRTGDYPDGQRNPE